jgi:hypothetical protein
MFHYLVVATALYFSHGDRVGKVSAAFFPGDAYGSPPPGGSRSTPLSHSELGGGLDDYPGQGRGPAFEDQVSAWRQQQIERSQQYHDVARNAAERMGFENPDQVAEQMLPQVDEKGRMTLVQNSVAKSSLAFWFFILMWRSVMLYELADGVKTSVWRVLVVTPPVILFIGNMLGCVMAIMTVASVPHSTTKKRLKALLNMNKLLELVMFVYNFIRLTIWPNQYIPKELYVGRIIHNVLYTVASQTFTKVTWDAVGESKPLMEDSSTSSLDGGVYQEDEFYNERDNTWDEPYQQRGQPRY